MPYLTLLPIYADSYFRTGSAGYGLLNAAHGVGALLATLTVATIAHRMSRRVPDRLRGRVLSLYPLCGNLLPLGGLLAGVLAAPVDARFAVLVGGAVVTLNALPFLTSRRLRAMR